MLTDTQIERYSRHVILPQVGGRGQERLLAARVGIVGDGELALTAALYLAAAGVGHLGVSTPIVRTLDDLNPDCHTAVLSASGDSGTMVEILDPYEVVLDAPATADLSLEVGAACRSLGKCVVWARANGCRGWITVLAGNLPDAPCSGCVTAQFASQATRSDAVTPLAATTAQVLGAVAAMEAIKAVLGIGTPLVGRLLRYDAVDTLAHETALRRDPGCALCAADRPMHPPTEGR